MANAGQTSRPASGGSSSSSNINTSQAAEPSPMLTLGDIESSPYILVMQCRHCKSIVGDSTAWWASCPRLAMVALFARHDNVALEATMAASTGGTDVGCSFWWLHCRSCLTHIGKRYETTRKEFDYVRDMFCYWVDRIIWYRVGSFVNEPGAVVTNEEVFSLPSTVAIARELALLKNEINLLRASATGQPGQATPPSTASLSKESPVLQQQQMMPPRASDAAAAMHKGKATVRNERKLVATGPQRVAPSVPAVTTQQHPPLQNLSAADLTQRINHAAQHQRQTVEMQDLLRRQAAYTRNMGPSSHLQQQQQQQQQQQFQLQQHLQQQQHSMATMAGPAPSPHIPPSQQVVGSTARISPQTSAIHIPGTVAASNAFPSVLGTTSQQARPTVPTAHMQGSLSTSSAAASQKVPPAPARQHHVPSALQAAVSLPSSRFTVSTSQPPAASQASVQPKAATVPTTAKATTPPATSKTAASSTAVAAPPAAAASVPQPATASLAPPGPAAPSTTQQNGVSSSVASMIASINRSAFTAANPPASSAQHETEVVTVSPASSPAASPALGPVSAARSADSSREADEPQPLPTRADEPAKSGTPPTSPTSSPKAAATTSTAIAKPANLRSATEDDLPVESPRGKRDGSVVSVGSQDSNASTVSSAGKRFMPVIEISGRPEKRRNLGNDKSVPGGATDTDADTAPTATSAATTTTTTSLDTVAEPQNAARPSSSLNPAKGSFFSKWVRQGSLSQKGAVPAPSRPPKFTFNKSIPKPTTAPSTTATTTTAESKDAPNPLQNTVRKAVDVVVVEDDSDSEEEGQLS